jgi:uncharacterized protein involved in exopolysaccharide biosynthesis
VRIAEARVPEIELPAGPTLQDYSRLAIRRKWAIAVSGLLGALVLFGSSYLIPPVFKAEVSMIPMAAPDRFGSLGVLGVQLQDLGIMPEGPGIPPAMYPEIVESRTVLTPVLGMSFPTADKGVTGNYLVWSGVKAGDPKAMGLGLARLRRKVSTSVNRRTGLMTVEVRERDPLVASDLANKIAENMQGAIISILADQASRTRQFVEGRLTETRADLLRAEENQRAFREQNIRIGNSPRLQIEDGRYARAVREQEEVFLTLQRQLELAKIEERRDVPRLAILDAAVPPVARYWPKRLLFLAGGFLLGIGAAFVVLAAREISPSIGG